MVQERPHDDFEESEIEGEKEESDSLGKNLSTLIDDASCIVATKKLQESQVIESLTQTAS